jgi:hypothetical protein
LFIILSCCLVTCVFKNDGANFIYNHSKKEKTHFHKQTDVIFPNPFFIAPISEKYLTPFSATLSYLSKLSHNLNNSANLNHDHDSVVINSVHVHQLSSDVLLRRYPQPAGASVAEDMNFIPSIFHICHDFVRSASRWQSKTVKLSR